MPLGSLFAASVCGTGVYGRDNEDSWPRRPCHQLLCLLHDCVARASMAVITRIHGRDGHATSFSVCCMIAWHGRLWP
jgi:hypothetical protein